MIIHTVCVNYIGITVLKIIILPKKKKGGEHRALSFSKKENKIMGEETYSLIIKIRSDFVFGVGVVDCFMQQIVF